MGFKLTTIVLLLCFYSCSTKTSVQEVRHPLIQFSYDSLSWKDDNYIFLPPTRVVAYPADPTQPGLVYNRFILQASGRDTKGRSLQVNIAFDVADSMHMPGLYQQKYTTKGGLAQVQLLNFDNNDPSSFQLCADDSSSVLQIQKQSLIENLVTGIFQFTLCNARDSTQKIKISNGILTDIRY